MISLFACGLTAFGQDYFDDVYYNPKKDQSTKVSARQKQSNYIANMGDMDVDAYNRRGEQYYVSQIDTIGTTMENGEDFVYTQQIQKFYNPTIVVDNATALTDVLSNAYGNVDIVINNNGYPVFAPWNTYGWPYYSSVWSPWSWSFNVGSWGWNVGWYDPWYSWNWGWGPSWNWGWGPGWGPAWRPGPVGPAWRPGPALTWRPWGNRVIGPRPGWANPAPPQGNIAHTRPPMNYGGANRPGTISRPGSVRTTRPAGVVNNGGRWEYNHNQNASPSTGHRTPSTGVSSGRTPQHNSSGMGNHSSGSGRTQSTVSGGNRSNSSNHRSVSSGRTTTTRSSGGGSRSTGGGRSSGGGGGGRRR